METFNSEHFLFHPLKERGRIQMMEVTLSSTEIFPELHTGINQIIYNARFIILRSIPVAFDTET